MLILNCILIKFTHFEEGSKSWRVAMILTTIPAQSSSCPAIKIYYFYPSEPPKLSLQNNNNHSLYRDSNKQRR